MNRDEESKQRRTTLQGYLLTAFVLMMLSGFSSEVFAQSQWTTNGNNINSTNTGNVGIGTTSPVYKLTVDAGAASASSTSTFKGASGTLEIWNQPTVNANLRALGLGVNVPGNSTGSSTGDFLFSTYNGSAWSERVRIQNSNGNVGIGTAGPLDRLHVESTANDLGLFLRNTLTSLNATNRISFAYGTTTASAAIESVKPSASSVATDLQFKVHNGGTISIPLFLKNDGNVGIGTTSPTAKLDVNGDINVTGNINAKYQDIAEWVPAAHALPAATVVVLNPTKSNQVMASAQQYDTRVAGVISERPGLALGEAGKDKVLVATTGRVKVKVDASRAAIHIGDLLVTSDKEGVAMKSVPLGLGGTLIHRPGTLIGKALEPLEKGTGEILVLLSLQ